MRCPRCTGQLRTETYETTKIARCWDCAGSWIPGDRLVEIVEAHGETFGPEALEAYRLIHQAHEGLVNDAAQPIGCPTCGSRMTQSRYPYAAEVLIDRCPEGHGVWLDKGELEHVQMAVEQEESELRSNVAAHGLSLGTSSRDELEREQGLYKPKLWALLLWPG